MDLSTESGVDHSAPKPESFNLVAMSTNGSGKELVTLTDIISVLPVSPDSFYYIDNRYVLRDKYGTEFLSPCIYAMMLTSNIIVYLEDETTLHVYSINKNLDRQYSFDTSVIHLSGRYPEIWVQTTSTASVIHVDGSIETGSFPSNVRRVFYTENHYADYYVDESTAIEYYDGEQVSRNVNVKAFYFDDRKLHIVTEPDVIYADRYMKVYRRRSSEEEKVKSSFLKRN